MGNLFEKIALPLPLEDILKLRRKPIETWPDAALAPWWWRGATRQARIQHGRYHRTRAIMKLDGRIISPARVLFDMFSKDGLQSDQKVAFNTRGQRGPLMDDVNPAHYHIVKPKPEPKTRRKKELVPNADILGVMAAANFWPTSIDELLLRWPELENYSREELRVTLEAT